MSGLTARMNREGRNLLAIELLRKAHREENDCYFRLSITGNRITSLAILFIYRELVRM